ncbi:MAG: NUDIX hydrolase [Gammaproteobacteria bacterium HGW-Gammaproteobacteria-7]|nr:MAG: NUDIX hydrolase [Gammaproteobacteria bacterium HGW-Gammaproteobacteria-7]
MSNARIALAQTLSAYRDRQTTQSDQFAAAEVFAGFLESHPDVFQRSHAIGHFTGSAWLVSADGARVLLTHHRKLDRWLQPGGHADGDADLARVALCEAEEESGLKGLSVVPEIFDLDRHRIPARMDEPEHWHYDVRFVVRTGDDEAFVVSDESHALAWRRIDEIAADTDAEASMQRMARRWLERQATGVY